LPDKQRWSSFYGTSFFFANSTPGNSKLRQSLAHKLTVLPTVLLRHIFVNSLSFRFRRSIEYRILSNTINSRFERGTAKRQVAAEFIRMRAEACYLFTPRPDSDVTLWCIADTSSGSQQQQQRSTGLLRHGWRHVAKVTRWCGFDSQQLEMGKNPEFCVLVRFGSSMIKVRFCSGSSSMGYETCFLGGHLLRINCKHKYQETDWKTKVTNYVN